MKKDKWFEVFFQLKQYISMANMGSKYIENQLFLTVKTQMHKQADGQQFFHSHYPETTRKVLSLLHKITPDPSVPKRFLVLQYMYIILFTSPSPILYV